MLVATKEKHKLVGGTSPFRPPPQSPPEVYLIYSLWEQIDPLLLERSMSRLPFHSLRLIRDLGRDFLCAHAHTYQLTELSPGSSGEIVPL